MRLNKLKVVFVITEFVLLQVAFYQMLTTRGWINNTFIFLPILNFFLFCSRKELKEMFHDFNKLLKETDNLEHFLYKEYTSVNNSSHNLKPDEHIHFKINRLEQKKRSYNEDLNENLISENEYDNFIRRCNLQISALKKQLDKTSHKKTDNISSFDFGNTPAVISEMLKNNEISKPDRIILTQMVNCIYIYENNTVKIVYNVDHL